MFSGKAGSGVTHPDVSPICEAPYFILLFVVSLKLNVEESELKNINGIGSTCILAGLFAISLASTTVYAATVNVNFDAEVYEVNDPSNILGTVLGLSVDLGDTFSTGYNIDSSPSFTFDGPGFPLVDTSVYTASPASTFADYEGTILSALSAVPGNIFIGNDYDSGDGEIVDSWRILAELLPATGSHPQIMLGIILFDETASRLGDSGFFVNDSLDGWDNAVAYISTNEGDILMLASGVSIVPLPPVIWLFLSGLLGLFGVAKSKSVG